jgi:hypothetical protein
MLDHLIVSVVDAMTDQYEPAHRQCVEKVFPRIEKQTTTEELLAVLDGQRA